MKLSIFKKSLAAISFLLLAGCCVDHTGLLPPAIDGQVYDVNCRIVFDHNDEFGVPITTESIESGKICSNGPPSERFMLRRCEVLTRDNRENYEMMYPGYVNPPFFEAVSSSLNEGELCPSELPSSTPEGEGEVIGRTDPLSSGGNNSYSDLQSDELGKILGQNSLTNSSTKLVDSQISVGAKFLKWRYADTTAQGQVEFDRFNCNQDGECDLVLRHLSLDFDDFTIVRPSIFARDVPVRDARLYTVQSHVARVDSDGRFIIEGVEAVVMSVIDGEKVNLLSNQGLKIFGQFEAPLHGQNHAALSLNLKINEGNEHYRVTANAQFRVTKFPSKLATGKNSSLCLVGGERTTYREARVENCDFKRAYQVWSLEEKGRYLRIRQPVTNTCLNVKSGSENYDGGIVSIVNCSDHWDQLWAIDHDGNVVNLHTQKCLDVGRNKNRAEDDLVTIHTCNAKAGGQDWTVRRPG